ncbi:MAB_1171c family putative transporter [Dactylosporangium sp. CA-139114]|uniref:MAB_1171c family putative transporter n=1 Tax=Dactylosporangium sp. CA-139114 TaxID=3239931 RepID=UPI003D981916
MAFADTLEFLVLGSLWAFTIWRFATPQPPRGRAVRLVVMLAALSFTFNRREISFATDRLLHVADISVPLKNLATVAASAAMVHVTGLMPGPLADRPRLRRWAYALLAVTGVTMAVLFVLAPRSPARGDFVAEHAGTPLVTAYGVLTQFGLFVGLACCLALFHPAAGRAERGALRAGLRLLTAAALVGLLFIANRVAFQVSNALGSDVMNGPGAENLSRVILAAMLLLFAAGAALPAIGGLQRWLAHYAALQRLRPLWAASVAALPHVVLGDPPSRLADLLTLRGVDLRLYRRIIEIRDAQWELGQAQQAPPDADTSLVEQARALLRTGSVVATPDVAPTRRPGHNDPPDAPSASSM